MNNGTVCSGFGRAHVCPRRHQCQRYLDGRSIGAYQPVSIMHMPKAMECPSYKPVVFSRKGS